MDPDTAVLPSSPPSGPASDPPSGSASDPPSRSASEQPRGGARPGSRWARVRRLPIVLWNRLPAGADKKLAALSALAGLLGTLVTGVVFVVNVLVGVVSRPTPPERTPSCHVRAAESQLSGYVLADRPTSGRYEPGDEWQCNSRHGRNSVRRDRVGAYTVRFPGLGVDGGTVEVTAAGGAAGMCGVVDWRPSDDGKDMLVRVWCADHAGAPADTAFFARFLFLRGVSSATAYLRADRPRAAGYTLNDAYRYNSKGGSVSITKRGGGSYAVLLERQQEPLRYYKGGVVTVTAAGADPAFCAVDRWFDHRGTHLAVFVDCYTPPGVPADAAFTMTYSVDLGATRTAPVQGAHLWADQPSAARYSPSMDYQYNSGRDAVNRITRKGTGHYLVHLPGLTRPGGNVQVSAYRSAAVCGPSVPAQRRQGKEVTVRCHHGGQPVDVMFTLAFWQ
jgi:hypothetical protein